jgi:hypothetical protein
METCHINASFYADDSNLGLNKFFSTTDEIPSLVNLGCALEFLMLELVELVI